MKYNVIGLSLMALISIGLLYGYSDMRKQYSDAMINVKAYASSLSVLEDQNRVFRLSLDQLEYFNDSLTNRIVELKEEIGIKDKNIKWLQYNKTSSIRVDTITLKDTIFKDVDFRLDTLIGDKWFNINLTLEYPSLIITKPSYLSENLVVIGQQKETIKPPKKFFIARWFLKKHKVLIIDINELNPYVTNKQHRYIEVIK